MLPDAITAAINAERRSRPGSGALAVTATAPAEKPLTIYVGNVYGRNVEPNHWMSIDALRSAKTQREHNVRVMFRPTWNDALVCRARSKTATAFLLDSDADVHVSIDGDILFEPWQVVQIARQAVTHGMVAGLYITRSRQDARPTSIFEPGVTITFSDDPTPQPARWLASGFTATSRAAMQAVADGMPLCHPDREWRFYPLYQPFVVDGPNGPIYLSEDFAFCQRAVDRGITPHIAPNIRIYHLGLHGHRLEDCLAPPIDERPITVTYQEDGRFKFEA